MIATKTATIEMGVWQIITYTARIVELNGI